MIHSMIHSIMQPQPLIFADHYYRGRIRPLKSIAILVPASGLCDSDCWHYLVKIASLVPCNVDGVRAKSTWSR